MGIKHSRTLTLQQLKDKGACTEQTRLFKKLFGTEVNVTVQAVLAVSDKFDWSWAARYLLSDSARDEYFKACDAEWAEYYAARDEYYKSRAAAFATAYINDSNY